MKTRWWKTLGLPAFTLLFALAGCSQSSDKPDAGDGYADGDGNGNGDAIICQKDQDCPTGQKCRGGLCEAVIACDCNYHCGERGCGLICNRGSHECESGTAPAEPCSDNCDCYANETCSGNKCVPMGGDGVECNNDDDCDATEKCLDAYCVPRNCTTRDDCAGPVCLVCKDGECTAPPAVCQGDQDCCVGYHCNFGVCAEDPHGCQSDADCEDPEFPSCINGECMPECVSDVDCSGGQICIDNHCKSPGCTPDQCETGEWCDPDAADGLGACVPGCDSHDDCGAGELCNDDTHQCMDDCCGGCQADQYCDTDLCTCKTKCTGAGDCAQGEKCNLQTGECEPEGSGEGSACQNDEDCAEGLLCDNCGDCTYVFGPPATFTCCYECSMLDRQCTVQNRECFIRRSETMTAMCVPM